MQPFSAKMLLLLVAILSFFPARSQYRLMIHDKLHNSYSEYRKGDKYTIITSDSLMRTGTITGFTNTSVSLSVKDSIHTIALASIVNLGIGARNNKGARVATRIAGFILTTVGAMSTLATLESIGQSDNQAITAFGVASAVCVAGGILMIRASYLDYDGNNRDFITRPRYRFRVVQSAF